MNMFKKLIEDYKAANKKTRDEQAERERLAKDFTIQEAQSANKCMEAKFCPIVSGKCRSTCVNFQRAIVHSYTDGEMDTYYSSSVPRCKLWK